MEISLDTNPSLAVKLAASVRRAVPADTDALTVLVNRAYEVEAAFLRGKRTDPAEIGALIGAGGFLVLEGGSGLCAAVLYHGPGEHAGLPPSHAYFGMLSVQPELQGMGLGHRLVRLAEAMAEATGATAMRLLVINLRDELCRWYKRLGYREIGTSPYTGEDAFRPCHFVEMAKPLRHSAQQLADAHACVS